MLEFYPNISLAPAMLPEHSSLSGPDCNGRTGEAPNVVFWAPLITTLHYAKPESRVLPD
jgi:hypothetical protein